MSVSVAYLGPPGTYAEAATEAYLRTLPNEVIKEYILNPYPTIAQALQAVAQGEATLAVVPVENSIEGNVALTLDTIWQLEGLQIQQALVLPIENTLLSRASSLEEIKTVYSHPQPLGQCQRWLEKFLPSVQLVPTNSTVQAIKYLENNNTTAAIASARAARLYDIPILVPSINDYPDNCTRFWLVSLKPSPGGSHTSLAFSTHDVPGALVKPLQVLASRGINMSRIESRPTKRSLGEYIFFIDLEADASQPNIQEALTELASHTEIVKLFGSYNVLPIDQ
ncbi:MAG TPA: prephenate dehydratase [Cyanobacteria bacterium UBA11149]|nr:prephenate dehydratase [Cyanobacteria bacterium UBA11367]HBE57235.1 prephenate dehydratase [Cyanobacteria bacterium UBA11366]HBK65658.1 prephenate dehydratase [Cyanobacteria bacterium UBA11166]HBR74648.1 prephenate dehydratase [Cyanobacteria bacterium UBA11159]HBS71323.1 prephenate dehydratase [Cyanobacteria bacterium UBA11153]HBW88352.1 prephenate dehydratase [Cyanobacteria bacterium UBA11149]HCA97677.1 prephenate dehydratase [Cyanobacteria bacterium UBA9226]